MRRIFSAFCGLLAGTLLLSSCLSSSDDDVTTYDDMAIMTFTLGTLNRYLHTNTDDGRDSIYKTTYSAAAYKMNIDQVGYRIYNADSLLTKTDVSRVVCTVTTKNSGIVLVKSMTSDSLTYLNSGTDSIDFSQPRIFRVYSNDGQGSRDYTVSLSVRQQDAGVFNWVEADKANFPADAEGEALRQKAEAAGLTYLGRTAPEAYAVNGDGLLMESEDGGATWKKDSLETDAALLPQSARAYVSWALDGQTDYALLVGHNPASGKAMTLWRKLADYDYGGRWVYMPLDESNPYYLPKLDAVQLVYYNRCILAFGSDGLIYVSPDQGITWKTTSTYLFPVGFSSTSFRVATDDEGYVWLTDNESGKTWRAYLSK